MMPVFAIACIVVSIVIAATSLVMSARMVATARRLNRKDGGKARPKRAAASAGGSHQKKGFIERIGTMNLILILVGVALLVFTLAMIDLFKQQYAIPDTLCTCVFAVLGGECGVMGWIKTTKEKNEQRRWEQEDRRQQTRPPPAGGEDEQPKG